MNDVLKTTILLADIKDYKTLNPIYKVSDALQKVTNLVKLVNILRGVLDSKLMY